MEALRIGKRRIGHNHPCFIIAEIGQNHNGDVYKASRMVQIAESCGVDGVKFQKRELSRELTPSAAAAPYHGPHSYGDTYGEHRAKLELSTRDAEHLYDRHRYNKNKSALFYTPCDPESVEALDPWCQLWKVASRDLDNWPLLERLAATGKPTILSTGMARGKDIRHALSFFKALPVALLYCVSKYPCEYRWLNLERIQEMRDTYNVPVGFSDHTTGIKASVTAVAMGACIIEKHFTLHRSDRGSDHACSLEPAGLQKLVRDIRHIEEAIGGKPADVTKERHKLGRSVCAARDLPVGHRIGPDDMQLRSPGDGVHWPQLTRLLRKVVAARIPAGEQIRIGSLST